MLTPFAGSSTPPRAQLAAHIPRSHGDAHWQALEKACGDCQVDKRNCQQHKHLQAGVPESPGVIAFLQIETAAAEAERDICHYKGELTQKWLATHHIERPTQSRCG
jgi:hypothetical protein